MKRVVQPTVRKVYGAPSAQQESQMNAVRKIHNLLSSGAVTVTGPNQPRILKQKVGVATNVTSSTSPANIQNSPTQIVQVSPQSRCYVCDEAANNQCTLLSEAVTTHTNTKMPNKIGQLIGEAFMVIISLEDVICKRCVMMINHLDRLELDFERVKTSVLNFIFKKYALSDDDRQTLTSPPAKMQKMNSGNTARKLADDEHEMGTRKIVQSATRDNVDNQLSNIFESAEKQQTQTKMIVQQQQQQPQQVVTQQQTSPQTPARKGPIKIYKCMSCDFKTTDLKQFQPHYDVCRQQNGYRCKTCKKVFVNMTTLKQHIAEKHPNEFTCNICNSTFLNEVTLKKHIEMNHPENKPAPVVNVVSNEQVLHACTMCQYKTTDKTSYDEHLRKHVKVKPFKCRICSVRFETREQASIHAKTHQTNFFKCGTCSASFPQRELLVKHFETHQPKAQQTQQQQVQIQQQQATVTTAVSQQQQQQSQQTTISTQKLLQDTIDEALRENETLDSKGIHFFSCNICSLTFIQENYYNQHMEMHKREKKNAVVVTAAPTTSQSLIREIRSSSSNILTTTTTTAQAGANIPEADIESIFEKMHSDKGENEASISSSSENLVITRQETASGGITLNITLPQQEGAGERHHVKAGNQDQQQAVSSGSVGIDMPVLDQPDDAAQRTSAEQKIAEGGAQQQQASGPVSMPSLDDEGDSQSQPSNTDHVPMDLEEMQNAVDGSQIKFILNENGQILQLDNHIITTDADGNQILVQGTDSEQIQQLLQSVGVLQSADGLDGELQMIGDNNQMIIVQQDGNEAQLIDASLLNADGHIVIQQQDGEGAHAIGEDGVRIPVSVAYTTNEQGETVAIHTTQAAEHQEQENDELMNQQDKADETQDKTNEQAEEGGQQQLVPVTTAEQMVATTQSMPTSSGSETFFALEDLMQQSEQKTNE